MLIRRNEDRCTLRLVWDSTDWEEEAPRNVLINLAYTVVGILVGAVLFWGLWFLYVFLMTVTRLF
jgi:hypothetical protein